VQIVSTIRGMRKLLIVFVVLVVAAGAAWFNAGRAPGPSIDIARPAVVGQTGELSIAIGAPGGALTRLEVLLEQDSLRTELFSLPGNEISALTREDDDVLRLRRPLGRELVPELRAGEARLVVTAARPVLFGYREAEASAEHAFEVRLTPPRVNVVSQFHYINHAGSEMVVYRVSPPEAESGVRVGDREYRGFPAAGAGVDTNDPGLRVAFFALLWDQDLNTPIELFARDELGNVGTGRFDYRTFERNFRASRINVNDPFLSRVVPAILAQTPELRVDDPTDLLDSYLRINRDLRRINNEQIAALTKETAPEMLWRGPFKQLINTAVEAGFADHRTYYYGDEEIDRQVHLGFDLASTANAPVLAANRGRVLYAGWLGIYGETVILDHGMGLQTLYSHLSSIDVQVGEIVEMDHRLGRTGITGLAGGDHLHFTTLLGGQPVTPIDWWSSQWVEDRILRKLRDAGAPQL
jgi:murein DD-endopeptidase MepM/ murein hydrolase activator NlpD